MVAPRKARRKASLMWRKAAAAVAYLDAELHDLHKLDDIRNKPIAPFL